jgi:hypothetical protein
VLLLSFVESVLSESKRRPFLLPHSGLEGEIDSHLRRCERSNIKLLNTGVPSYLFRSPCVPQLVNSARAEFIQFFGVCVTTDIVANN